MAEEKTKTRLIDEAMALDGSGGKRHGARKYKRAYRAGSKFESFAEGLELAIGTRVIVRINDGSAVSGYLLCAVIDFDDDKPYWSLGTDFIVEVLEAGCLALEGSVGRLMIVNTGHSWGRSKRVLIEVGKSNWAKFRLSNGANQDK